jgi:hypothetical protein
MEVGPRYIASARTAQKTSSHYCVFSRCRGNNVSTESFPSNGCCNIACLHSCYLAMGLHVTVCNHAYHWLLTKKTILSPFSVFLCFAWHDVKWFQHAERHYTGKKAYRSFGLRLQRIHLEVPEGAMAS